MSEITKPIMLDETGKEMVTAMDKIAEILKKNGGSGAGGGVSSWNDLTDKPFGETTVMGDTLTWDGNTDGLETAESMTGGLWYKVSDKVFSAEQLIGATIVVNGQSAVLTTEHVIDYGALILIADGLATCVPNAIDESGTIITSGLYFELGVTSLIVPDKTKITPVPTEYLDFIETVESDTLTWDRNTSGLTVFGTFCKVSDSAVSTDDLQNGGTAVFDTMTIQFTSEDIVPLADNLNGVMHPTGIPIIFFALADNIDMGDGNFIPEKGIYFAQFTAEGYTSSLTINGYTGFTKEQIKTDYVKNAILEVLTEKGLI